MLKKTRRILESSTNVPPPSNLTIYETDVVKENTHQNYANLQFAQSLAHYENVRDLRVHIDSSGLCIKCQCSPRQSDNTGSEDHLLMGPLP